MKRELLVCLLLFTTQFAYSQIVDPGGGFSMTAAEIRELSSYELDKPNIPDSDVGNNPTNNLIPRPIYLIWRYYSCLPWYRWHVRDVYTSLVPAGEYQVEVDTQDDTPDKQIVTDINHAAYGLYCLRIVICVPWDRWVAGWPYPRFYVRLHHLAPYWCWVDHWWYYWRVSRDYLVRLNSEQEVPVNASPGIGSGTLTLNPGGILGYNITYSGLTSPYLVSHIHGPAPAGQNADPIFTLDNTPNGPNTGTLSGTTPPLTATQVGQLNNSLWYVNIHSGQFPNGEIRGQIIPVPPQWCPWGPSWIPVLRWTRGGPVWGLTVTHPYCYPWFPGYIPRPFCLYGLQHYFTPIVNPRNPAQVPFISDLNSQLQLPWQLYHYRPFNYYWPYTPYCARWYWWRCAPFYDYWWLPPIVRFGIWAGDDQAPGEFPDDPRPIPGTVGIVHARALVAQPADLDGDGFTRLTDLLDYRTTAGAAPSQDAQDPLPVP
ncbi:MAG: CHRD domain-containing protein [Verrucomicrobia subdivision 3 bacterium]|nr:CHRD domain-containing protein [Limisphaerales bacterium]